MRALLDACVLYPTVLREILLGVAGAGGFTPLWSDRLLEEWALAAARLGPSQDVVARGEIALVRARWPGAMVTPPPELAARLWLPDADDVHVLAAAVTGGADVLVTLNLRDFPKKAMDAEAILLRHPDEFLLALLAERPEIVAAAVARVHAEAERLSGQSLPLRALLKRAYLPRLGKALERG